jgi:hypothetical protein
MARALCRCSLLPVSENMVFLFKRARFFQIALGLSIAFNAAPRLRLTSPARRGRCATFFATQAAPLLPVPGTPGFELKQFWVKIPSGPVWERGTPGPARPCNQTAEHIAC